MKVTKAELKRIIKEEIQGHLSELGGTYAQTGAYPDYPLFGYADINGIKVGAITNAGKRPSYAIPPVSDRGKEALETFKKLRAAVHQQVEAGEYEGYSTVLIDPAPRAFGRLVLTTNDGQRVEKRISVPQ